MSSSTNKSKKSSSRAAFDGAAFDKAGYCLRHKNIQLAEQVKQDGKLMWKELKMNCPKCAAEHHKSRRVTSLGGAGKVKRGRTVHGMSNPLRDTSKARHMDKEFDTPFDDKGRCHHHPNVQMATKKARGGWKIINKACPRCIEANYDEEVSVYSGTSSRASSKYSRGTRGGDDDRSVRSGQSRRSVTTRTKPVAQGANYDKNGCCTRHPTVNIAKKKLLGGWKEYRDCPKCIDPDYDDMSENASVSSKKSTTSFRSHGSHRSTRSKKSVKSNSSRKGGRATDRYGALPFDEEGYCHAHPSVRLAKKKALGGWKVLHDICPDCAQDASSQAGGSTRSGRSRRSSKGTGRVFDDSGSDASSYRSGKSGKSTSSRKKKIRVKDMRYRDENGKEGRYSGDVNEDHQPHGQGKMKYRDGSAFAGVWNDGSQAHGKTTRSKGSSKDKSSSSSRGGDEKRGSGKKSGDWARREHGKSTTSHSSSADQRAIANGGDNAAAPSSGKKTTVRRMKWMDYYGDPGEYTGEVDSSDMPDGRGSMKYDHGLIQEGSWKEGQFVEGSDMASIAAGGATTATATTAKKSGRSGGGGGGGGQKKSSRSGGGGERSSKKSSSRSGGGGGGSGRRNLEP